MYTRVISSTLLTLATCAACATTSSAPPPAPTPVTRPGPSSQPTSDDKADAAGAGDVDKGTDADADHDGGEAARSANRDQVDADGVVRRGAPLTASLEATPVSVAVHKAKELDGKKVKLTGTVSDVCSKRGCWFVVQGDKPEDHIRISTRAHDIFVPHSAVGMKAVVEGTLSTKVLDDKTAAHLASESNSDHKPAAGDVEIAIDVSGLEMSKG